MLPFWLIPHWQRLCWALNQSRPAHGLLLQSRHGLGIDELAHAYARRLLCLAAQGEQEACGCCAGCALTAAGHHPDLILVGIAEEKKGLSIEQIRDLSSRLQQRSHRGGFRIAILSDADTMSPSAANALLKTLEEPGADSVLMLLTHFPERISATLRSRCSRVSVNAPAESEASDWLQKETSKSAAEVLAVLRLSAGAPLLARARLRSGMNGEQELTQHIEALLQQQMDPVKLTGLCHDYERLLDCLLRRCHSGMQQPSPLLWAELSELTLEARRQLRAANNLTSQIVIEQLLIRWFDLARKLGHSKLA